MLTAELVSAEQYLHTSFEHDAEFVEGRIIERPMPTWEHSRVQGFLLRELWAYGLCAVPEQRVQTLAGRYRVPDVCAVDADPEGPADRGIVTNPPYLCVEVLSPEDSTVETMEKVREYLDFGVAWVWVIDPVSLGGQIHSQKSWSVVRDGVFSTDRITLDVSKARTQRPGAGRSVI